MTHGQPPTDKAVEAELREKIAQIVLTRTPRRGVMVTTGHGGGTVLDTTSASDKAYALWCVDQIMALIKSSNLALLNRIQEQVVGEDENPYTSGRGFKDGHTTSRNKLRDKQRQALTSIRKEYE